MNARYAAIALLLAAGCHPTEITFEGGDTGLPPEEESPALPTDLTLQPADRLEGIPSLPGATLEPASVDFGEVVPGCSETAELWLTNTGQEALQVDSVVLEGSEALTLATGQTLPGSLEPGAALEMTVTFLPEEEAAFSASLQVETDTPFAEPEASLAGEGRWPDRVTASFSAWTPVDLVLLLDRSGSMADDLAAIADQLEGLVQALDSEGFEWQVAVVSSSDGCADGVARYTDDDPAGILEDLVLNGGGHSANSEALLELARLVLEESDGGCNDGLLQPQAVYHALAVSDEDDQSHASVSSYVTALQELAGDEVLAVMSAMAGDVPDGCGTASPAPRYGEAVDSTGGVFLSICHDKGRVGDLAPASRRMLVPLDPIPVVDSIEVYVESEAVTEGWRWSESLGAVVFDEIPDSTDVEVSYVPDEGCGTDDT